MVTERNAQFSFYSQYRCMADSFHRLHRERDRRQCVLGFRYGDVNVNGPVALSTTGTGTICIGQSTTITATGSNGTSPYTYTWSNAFSGGSQSVSPNTTTTYSVDVVDAFGCSAPQQTV